MSWFWWILAIILGIGELLTVEFLLLWFSLGAVAAGFTALFLPFLYQLGVFVAVPFLLTVSARKIVNKKRTATNIEALPGKDAVVIETVKKVYCGAGLVKFNGEFWHAYTDREEIPVGAVVIIEAVEGTKLRVSQK